MYLPQNNKEERLDIKALYKKFRTRAILKSNNNYIEKSSNPVMMILNINHSVMDFQEGVLVKYSSFRGIRKSLDTEEIGFYVNVYSGFSNDIYRLTVLKIGKAFLEKEKDIREAINKKEKEDKKELKKRRKQKK